MILSSKHASPYLLDIFSQREIRLRLSDHVFAFTDSLDFSACVEFWSSLSLIVGAMLKSFFVSLSACSKYQLLSSPSFIRIHCISRNGRLRRSRFMHNLLLALSALLEPSLSSSLRSGKYPVGEISGRGNIRSGKYPVGEISGLGFLAG